MRLQVEVNLGKEPQIDFAVGITIYDGERFSAFNKADGTPFNNMRKIIEDRPGHI